jgi:hypothetical protein
MVFFGDEDDFLFFYYEMIDILKESITFTMVNKSASNANNIIN